MSFTHAILRTPCSRLARGLTAATLGKPDYRTAMTQHARYARVLAARGVDVKVLRPLKDFPDSVFVEDVAVCTPHCAVITRPGARSRRGEIDHVRAALESLYTRVETIEPPGTLEGGDVMAVGSHYFIGLTERTNVDGARQLVAILERYELTASTVPVETMLHLKSGVSYLENGTLLATGECLQRPEFAKFKIIEVDGREAYAANSVWANGTVLVPAGHPKTRSKIEAAGYPVVAVNLSEFRKLGGGLSCLSLRLKPS